MPYVLIAEDEPDLAQLLDFNLRQAGYDTQLAATGVAALAHARARKPDLVLLDVMLPDLSGIDVCKQLRALPATRDVLVVMLTAKGEESERIRGFEAGADDYVTKPFSVRELVLRLNAILRRSSETEGRGTVRVGRLTLELGAHRFLIDDTEVPLTALEFRLMHHFMTRLDRVQTRERLLEEVWGLSSSLETRTIDTHMLRLRDKLGPARSYIETVRGVGYRMTVPPKAG